MSPENLTRFRFGHWEADIATGELFKSGRKVRIQRQPFKVLQALLARAGQVVTREELREELWPGTHVEVDLSLNTALKKLRAILGDSSRLPIFIETIPQRGYRFLQKSQLMNPGTSEHIQDREFSNRPANVRLAVLPFENLDADGKDYFSDGVTRHILALCAGLDSSITMVAMPSVIRYRHTSKSALQLCRELKANYILTGSTLRSSHVVRVDVNLISSDQSCVWSHSYTYSALDILQGQDQISEHIVRSIAQVLAPAPEPKCGIGIPEHVYPNGNHPLLQGTESGLQKGVELFQQAMNLARICCGSDCGLGNRGWLGNSGEASYDASCAAVRSFNVAFIVDSDVKILDLSCAAARLLGNKSLTAVLGRRAGEVFHCIHSTLVPEGCGRAPICRQCVIRNSTTRCLEGHTVNRARTKMNFLPETNQKSKDFLITASASSSSERLALLIVEDITENAEPDSRAFDS
jgi:DNA-binding winged helix-turn-helix (wHTH) protein